MSFLSPSPPSGVSPWRDGVQKEPQCYAVLNSSFGGNLIKTHQPCFKVFSNLLLFPPFGLVASLLQAPEHFLPRPTPIQVMCSLLHCLVVCNHSKKQTLVLQFKMSPTQI